MIIGDDGVMIIDATATPVAAQGVIAKVREITDLPIKYVVLTHYHAVRVLGASGYKGEGLEQIIASQDTWDLIVERGQQDMDSRDRPLPAPVPGRGERARADLADHDLRAAR